MMQLYTNPQSRGNTILPFLIELNIEDQVELINISYEDLHQAPYLAIKLLAIGVTTTPIKYTAKMLASPALDRL